MELKQSRADLTHINSIHNAKLNLIHHQYKHLIHDPANGKNAVVKDLGGVSEEGEMRIV